MFRGMDAIDYEPDASLIDGSDDDIDYEDDRDSNAGGGSSESGGELDGWEGYSHGSEDSSDDSEEEPEPEGFAANDLRNPKYFPAYAECAPCELYDVRDDNNEPIPPPRHRCYLGEIVEHITYPIRNLLTVQDKDGHCAQLSSNFDLEAQFDVKVGSTIAVVYAEKKYFSLGVYGLRLDHAKFVKVSILVAGMKMAMIKRFFPDISLQFGDAASNQ